MWCEKVLENLRDEELAERDVDYVDIQWTECKAVLKRRSRGGEEVRVLLPRGERLRQGDVLGEAGGKLVVIHVVPCELIVVRADRADLLAKLAFELGNLHWPTEIHGNEVVFPEDDEPVEAVRKLGLEFVRQSRRFNPLPTLSTPLKIAGPVKIVRADQRPEADSADCNRASNSPAANAADS